ncbi:putative glycosylphosphatidylinositol-alpha 1,2 mannosyltransferase [Maudiozyma humilis]|uniref:Mannosyltransferase n=1 Tax=Maudiozyma humilis TaxID=51915 RepID=A0AAV5RVN3_MAUHU|nr:putative glycosylphosphatidylinositol-alpha 1,2 mannosyltransferase [Kazachstania humilis]
MTMLSALYKPNFTILVVWRVINSLLLHTYFQADEFWQSLEPAHLKAFGYGQLTWEWKLGIRGYLFPFLFELCYRFVGLISKVLTNFNVDPVLVEKYEYIGVLLAPKILMSILSAIGEYHMIILVRKICVLSMCHHKDEDESKNEGDNDNLTVMQQVTVIAHILSMANFFNWFAMTRTFVNSFEMILTSIALCHWDWTGGEFIEGAEFSRALFWAMITCFTRISNGLIWGILGGFMLLSIFKKRQYSKFSILFKKIISTFLLVGALNLVIDYYFYGEILFPIFRFLKFNFTSPLAKFYGVAPWHFYIFQGIPIVTSSALIPFIYGMRHSLSSKPDSQIMYAPFVQFKFVVLLNIIIFSSLAHKEFRFIYPLQPFFLVIATFGYRRIRYILSNYKRSVNFISCVVLGSVFAFAVLVGYYHESGVISVMEYIRNKPEVTSVGFIMPCHSTPWQSHFHRSDIPDMWSITCEPPLHLLDDDEANEKLPYYMDESDYLYDDIPKFIAEHMVTDKSQANLTNDKWAHEWPEYLIVFGHMDDVFMRERLENTQYQEEMRFFNTIGHWDSRRNGDVIVYHRDLL